jgi:hypothetical protein
MFLEQNYFFNQPLPAASSSAMKEKNILGGTEQGVNSP